MPRIPTTDPQVGLNIGNQPNMPLSFGTAPGRAVQKLGSAISGLQGTFNAAAKAQEKDDLFKTKLALGEFAGEQDRFQAEYDNGVSDDGSNHANKRLETYDKAAGKLYERIPQSEASRKYAALQLQRMRNRYGNQSTDVEIRQRGRYTINQTTGFIKNQVLPKITGEVRSALTGLDLINGLVESSPIRDDVKEKIRDGAVKTVLDAWVAKAGPEAAARAETLAAAYGPGAREGATPGSPRAAQEDNPNREAENVSREAQAKSASEFLRSRLAKGYEKRTGDVDNLNPVMQDRLGAFLQAAQEAGHDVRIISGHRSQQRQAVLWRNALKKYGSAAEARKWVAPPGGSSHNSGLAVDLQYGDRGAGLGGKKTAAVKWAHENARRYGLHFRLGHEDWHIEPVEVTRGGNAAGRVSLKETNFFKNGGMGRRRSSPTVFTSGKAKRQPHGWARTDQRWKSLNQFEKAALMSLMEAGGGKNSVNALGAMINRAAKEGEDLGAHVSGKIYQPTWESSQRARMDRLLNSPEFPRLVEWAKRRIAGEEPDPVNGATHFLVHEKTMLALEARNPRKYRSWRKWTKFDPKTGQYGNVMLRDETHAFNAPDGKFSYSPNGEGKIEVANDNPPDLKERFARELIKQLPQIQRASERAEREEQIAERRQQREIESATAKEATKLLVDGGLTEQWLEENEGNLSDSAYRRFLESIKPRVRVTNPKVLAELMERTDEDPDSVMSDALAARNAGELEDKDLRLIQRSIYGTAREAEKPEWEKSLRRDLKTRLRPSRDDGPDEWAAYYKAMESFDDYVEKNGEKLDRKTLTEFQTDLVKSTKESRIRAARDTLSMMRFSQVGRNALTLEEVNAAEIRMLQALQARKISQAEANAEWKLIKSWRKTLEDEYKALGKEPPKPQGPIRPQAADKAQAATPATPEAARFGFAPSANLEVNPAVAAEVKAYSETLPDEVKMQLLDETGNPKPETMQLVSSAMALGATPDKVPSILKTIYGIGDTSVPFYQQDGVNVSTGDFNQAYQKESDWQSSPWGAIDSWAERMIGQYDQAASSDESDMTRRQLLEMLGVEILSDDDYADVQRRWKESQEWIKQNVPTSVARGLLQFGNSLLSVRGNDIADLDQAVPLDPVIMGLEGLRSATRWLSMNPNRIQAAGHACGARNGVHGGTVYEGRALGTGKCSTSDDARRDG
jgi:LAS superfamily LD-carboxypeptidase LdcB